MNTGENTLAARRPDIAKTILFSVFAATGEMDTQQVIYIYVYLLKKQCKRTRSISNAKHHIS